MAADRKSTVLADEEDIANTRALLKFYLKLVGEKKSGSRREALYSLASKLGVHPDDMGGFNTGRVTFTALLRASLRLIIAMETEKLQNGVIL